MKPTVALDATPFLFRAGGVGRTTHRLVQELLTLPDLPVELRLVARSLRGPMDLGGVDLPVRRLRLPRSAEPWIRRLGLLEKLAPADLYHAPDHAMPLRDPSRAVATLHDLLFLVRPEPHLAEQHAYQARTVPPFAKQCRHILTCSQHSKRDIMEHLDIPDERITVAPWGIDRADFPPPSDPAADRKALGIDSPYLLAVSCSFGRKNTNGLLDAWQQLGDKRRDHKLLLVWSPAADLHPALADPSVITTGRVSDEDLIRLYGNADMTLFPSFYEGFGLPVLESMSCGTPVLTTSRSSLPEVGGDACVYIDPDQPDELIEQLRRVCAGEIDLANLQQRGFAHCDTFTWRRCAETTLSVYQHALEGSS